MSNFFFLLELSKILDCQFYFFDKLILSLKWTPLYTPSGHVLIARIKQNISDVIYYDLFVDQIPHVKNRHNNFNFLRKPAADKDIIARCRLIKLGKTLAVGDVEIYSDGIDDMVAHATGTYAIPPMK